MLHVEYIDAEPSGQFEQLTITSANAVGLTAAKYTGANNNCKGVYITIETYPVRFRIDGVAANANVGHYVPANGSINLKHPKALANLSIIGVGGDASGMATYYK